MSENTKNVIAFIVIVVLLSAGVWLMVKISGTHNDKVNSALVQIQAQLETDIVSWSVFDACAQYICTPQSLRVETSSGVFDCAVNGERPICVKVSP